MADDQTDEWHDKVLGMADDLELTGNDRRKYIHEHMTRKGYRMEPSYVKSEEGDEEEEEDSGFFSSGKRKSSSRTRNPDDPGGRSRRSRREHGGADDWYS